MIARRILAQGVLPSSGQPFELWVALGVDVPADGLDVDDRRHILEQWAEAKAELLRLLEVLPGFRDGVAQPPGARPGA